MISFHFSAPPFHKSTERETRLFARALHNLRVSVCVCVLNVLARACSQQLLVHEFLRMQNEITRWIHNSIITDFRLLISFSCWLIFRLPLHQRGAFFLLGFSSSSSSSRTKWAWDRERGRESKRNYLTRPFLVGAHVAKTQLKIKEKKSKLKLCHSNITNKSIFFLSWLQQHRSKGQFGQPEHSQTTYVAARQNIRM